jgi:hypothetical protein
MQTLKGARPVDAFAGAAIPDSTSNDESNRWVKIYPTDDAKQSRYEQFLSHLAEHATAPAVPMVSTTQAINFYLFIYFAWLLVFASNVFKDSMSQINPTQCQFLKLENIFCLQRYID